VWTWCAVGRRNGTAADVAELSPAGRVELAGSTGYGRGARGVDVGAAVNRVRGVATSVGHGLFVWRGPRAAFVWAVRDGRAKAVGVATLGLAGRIGALRAAMDRVAGAHATQARRVFIPNATQRSGRLTGANLVATSADPRLNRALAVLCGLH
jgi:hypothetical protein